MLRRIHWHSILLAIYPTLHLLAQNLAAVQPRATLVPLAVAAVAAAVLWLIAGAILRSVVKGAVFTTATAALFFAHGHVLGLVGGGSTASWLLIAAGAVLVAGVAVLLWRTAANLQPWNRVLDGVAAILVLMVLVPIVRSELRQAPNLPPADAPMGAEAALGYLPDIYIVILDGMGRADVLNDIYGVDLAPLEAALEERGFHIARQATANYSQTSLSLSALFNADYITDLLPRHLRTFRNRKDLNATVRDNRVMRLLRGMDYQLVTIAGASELAVQADPDVNYRGGALNEFQAALLATTPLPTIATALVGGGDADVLDPFAQHRRTLRYQLEKLPHVTAPPGPKLVFTHVLAPHPPFVFAADGSAVTPDYEFAIGERHAWDGYVEGYAGQATWLASRLPGIVDSILSASRQPPVILFMGDHGPASRWIAHWKATGSFETDDPAIIAERMPIFLALLMPEGRGGEVYAGLTPVNVFPLVFERLFGQPTVRKPDHSFFSTYDQWSLLTNVDHIVRP